MIAQCIVYMIGILIVDFDVGGKISFTFELLLH